MTHAQVSCFVEFSGSYAARGWTGRTQSQPTADGGVFCDLRSQDWEAVVDIFTKMAVIIPLSLSIIWGGSSHTDSVLGHVTYFGQWDNNKCGLTRLEKCLHLVACPLVLFLNGMCSSHPYCPSQEPAPTVTHESEDVVDQQDSSQSTSLIKNRLGHPQTHKW